jgi:ATP-dependent exoDNAse (exonuclease V) alpha subunit
MLRRNLLYTGVARGRRRLALLAPDIIEAIVGGWADQRVMLERLERPLPAGWEEQHTFLLAC